MEVGALFFLEVALVTLQLRGAQGPKNSHVLAHPHDIDMILTIHMAGLTTNQPHASLTVLNSLLPEVIWSDGYLLIREDIAFS